MLSIFSREKDAAALETLPATSVASQNLTLDETLALPLPSEARLSPNGRYIVYELSTPDWKRNQHVKQLWFADLGPELSKLSGKSVQRPLLRQLTFGKRSSHLPRWSPDGETIAFLSRRHSDSREQLYTISPFGGEAKRLTAVATGIQTFAWSPDAKTIAYISLDDKSEADIARQEKYGSYFVENSDYRHAHLWVLTVESQQRRQITRGRDVHVYEFAWAPDSRQLVFTGVDNPDIENTNKSSLYCVATDSRSPIRLTGEGFGSPLWSPEGDRIACLNWGGPYYANNQTWILDMKTAARDRMPQATLIGKEFDENKRLVEWTSRGLFFSATDRTSTHLYCMELKNGRCTRLTPTDKDGFVMSSPSFDDNFAYMATVVTNAHQVEEVALINLKRKRLRFVTNVSEPIQHKLHRPTVIQWESSDGTPIDGVLFKPANMDPSRKCPLLVVIHGGPAGTSYQQQLSRTARRYYPIQQWVSKGAAVLLPNYRGSTGYGAAFRALNVRNLGVGDYADIISGVDSLIEEGWIDADRVGAMGWSQGGYISAFIATYSDRFKAVSVGAGISNWITYYVNTDIHPFTRDYLQATPWEEKAIYEKTSPMTYINRAQTPTLIQHGQLDQRVPVPNAYELYQGLQDMEVESRLVIYPGMPHGITRPRENRQVLEENWRWFNRFIWGESDGDKRSTVCYVTLPDESAVELVAQRAAQDRVDFRILSVSHGMMSEMDVKLPLEAHEEIATKIGQMIDQIASLIVHGGWKEIKLYNGTATMSSTNLMYVGALLMAAGRVGGVSVEHAGVDPEI